MSVKDLSKEATSKVLFQEINGAHGKIGRAILNRPKSLNSADKETFQLLSEKLISWERNPEVKMVVIDSSLPKAFCAGGDVKALAQDIIEKRGVPPVEYFKWEYRTDYFIHQMKTPVLVWGQGIVMGGGIGIMNGASHRVVTPDSLLAMPEISIGFFTDVAAGFFLNQLPGALPHFLALTGARISAGDAIHYKLADLCLPIPFKETLFQDLEKIPFTEIIEDNHKLLTEFLSKGQVEPPASYLAQIEDLISDGLDTDSFEQLLEGLKFLEGQDRWVDMCLKQFNEGSPLSAGVIFKQLQYCKSLDLGEVFHLEGKLALNLCGSDSDFSEGVRSILIDKDRNPKWIFSTPEDVEMKEVEKYFKRPHDFKEFEDFFGELPETKLSFN